MNKYTTEKLGKLINLVSFNNIDENDEDSQEYYFNLLNKLLDCILLLKYSGIIDGKMFVSINQINDRILNEFQTMNELTQEQKIIELARKITGATKEYNKYEYYRFRIEKLYELFKDNKKLSMQDTSQFYNEILNKQQNAYLSERKKILTKELTYKLDITDKKIKNLINTAKLKRAYYLMKFGEYEKLGTTEEEMLEKLEELHIHINSIKAFKNEPLSQKELKELDLLFINGYLTEDTIYKYTPEKRKVILNKYSQVLIPYLDNINEHEIVIDTESIEFNYNHIKVFNERKYQENRNLLISKLSEQKVEEIIDNVEKYKEILKLLPFVNILPEFSFELYYQIIQDYDKIMERLHKKNKLPENPKVEELVHNMSDIIKLAKIYKDLDEYTIAILGEEVIEKIMKETPVSSNPNEYLEYYHKMLNLKTTKIPQISGEWRQYIFENDKPYDKERLLIGKNCYRSCIGPKGVGAEAFTFALTSSFSDVLMIKNKETNTFVGRTIMYRLGNSIIFAPIQGEKGLNDDLYNEEFLTLLGNAILEESNKKGDYIDYILLTKKEHVDFKNIDLEYNECFVRSLPHCDLTDVSYIIGKNKKALYVNPALQKYKTYHKKRQEIKTIEEDINEELLRIKGLQIYVAHSENKKNHLKAEFHQVKETQYQKAYIGQDWYVAIKEDNTIEKASINNTKEVENEIKSILDNMIEDTNSNFHEPEKNKVYEK